MDIQDRIDCAERALTRANDLLKNLLQRDGVTIRMAHLACIAMADIDEAIAYLDDYGCAKNTPAPVAPETDVQNEDYSISSRPNIPPRHHKVKPRLVAKDPCKDCAQARPGGCPYTCAARNRYIAAVERYYSKTMLDV